MGRLPWSIQELDFEASARLEPEAQLTLSGNADSVAVSALMDMITTLHEQVCAASCRRVDVDIARLEFMSASCFNVFVNWVAMVNDLEPEQRYELRFTTNAAIPWQRRSLRTLSFFATDLVVVA